MSFVLERKIIMKYFQVRFIIIADDIIDAISSSIVKNRMIFRLYPLILADISIIFTYSSLKLILKYNFKN